MYNVVKNREHVMYVTTKSIVKKLPTNLRLVSVLNEAIANSIQANATKIDVVFETYGLIDDGCNVKNLIIRDNGDGFSDENIRSFNYYLTDFKEALGCKGIGRFTYLTICDKVEIISFNKNNQISFNFDIDTDSIKITHKESVQNKITEVKLLGIKSKRIQGDLKNEKREITNHFISTFMFAQKASKEIVINLYKNNDKLHTILSSETGGGFEQEEFIVDKEPFKIYFKKDGVTIKGFFCANQRVVKKDELNIKLRFKQGEGLLFFITSPFFDRKVNDIRSDFDIQDNNKTLFKEPDWKTINKHIYDSIDKIYQKNGIDIDEKTESNKKKSIAQAPYLAYYISKSINKVSTNAIIAEAKENFEKDKEYIRDLRNKSKSDYNERLNISTQAELAEYIYDRQKIIDNLKQIVKEEGIEEKIHNLFMNKNTKDIERNYKSNNLWLFDDRFMSYDKVFSDKQIKEIFPELSQNIARPDILSIISNTNIKDDITDIVIIELKRPDENITPAIAEEQLLKYARYIDEAKLKNKVRIWTYAFLKYSQETDNLLSDKDYNKIPTHSDYPIFYKYHEKRNIIINFMDFRALAFDAEKRNQTFINILKGES